VRVKQLPMLAVVALSAVVAVLLGLGTASVLAALPAMFCLIAAFGGTRYADLRLFGWFGPLLILLVGGLKALGGVAPWPAVVVVTVVVFGVGLMPVLGSRLVTVAMALGMASVFAYGYQISGPTTLVQDFTAPAISVVVVALLRVLLGAKDPEGPLRTAFATALTGPDTALVAARDQWQADRPRRWSTAALSGIGRYRGALRVLRGRRHQLAAGEAAELDEVLAAAEAEAGRLADELRARQPARPPVRVRRREPRRVLPGATSALVTSVWLGLEGVAAASADRDRSRVDVPPYVQREPLSAVLRGALNWDNAQLRHAVRCAAGMLVAAAVSQLFASSPLRLSFLMAVFAIMQPQLQDTLSKARQRVVGSVLGALVLGALVLAQLPTSALLVVGVVAFLVGFMLFMQTRPAAFNACTVLMSVGMNVDMRHLPLGRTLLEFLLLVVLAVLIGVGFGFVAVPGVPMPGAAVRFEQALAGTQELLRHVAAGLVTRQVDVNSLRRVFRTATGAHQNLSAVEAMRPEPTEPQREAAERAAEALQGLTASAHALLMRRQANVPLGGAVGEIAHQLGAEPDADAVFHRVPAVIDPEQQLLLDSMLANTAAVSEAAPALR
jgi:uncharacterized membrane protein YccC